MGKTFSEKILGRKAGREVSAGDFVEIEPDMAMSHDNTADISRKFYSLGTDQVYDPQKHVIVLDHATPPPNEKFAENHKVIREFVKRQKIRGFYDINRGICHQVLPEEGHIVPGIVAVGSDSHSTSYGAFGAFGTGIGRSEMAVIMATGEIWFRVPETVKILIEGEVPAGISSKDIILHIIGDLGADGTLYQAVEFAGSVVDEMSVAGRFVLSNMAVEFGAKAGYSIPNRETIEYLQGRTTDSWEIVTSDDDAEFTEIYRYDVSDLTPQVACPHTVDNVSPVSDVAGTKIDQVFFGSCTNARLEDFQVVAEVLHGKEIHPNVRMLVFPASREVLFDALREGYVQDILDAGAVLMNPGCGACMGNHEGVPADGEVVVSTSNRNFKGRMGNRNSEIYLASPRTAAVSALTGEITDFR